MSKSQFWPFSQFFLRFWHKLRVMFTFINFSNQFHSNLLCYLENNKYKYSLFVQLFYGCRRVSEKYSQKFLENNNTNSIFRSTLFSTEEGEETRRCRVQESLTNFLTWKIIIEKQKNKGEENFFTMKTKHISLFNKNLHSMQDKGF